MAVSRRWSCRRCGTECWSATWCLIAKNPCSHGPRCRHASKAFFTYFTVRTHTQPRARPFATSFKRLDSDCSPRLSPIINDYLSDNVRLRLRAPLRFAMSLSSFSSLSSYSSESDIGTLLDFNLFKSSSSRPRANANAHTHTRRRSPESPRSKDRRPSSSSRHTHTRAKQRSITPTRTPVSSSRYDDGARALVPYSFHSPGSKSGISYSDIDRWRAATIGGSEFTYSSESSVTVSSVTSPSYISSASRTRSSRIDSSSRRSAASGYKRQKAPSIAPQHPRPEIHHDPSQICEHCRTA